jgi:hypothetical protein
MSKEVMKRLLDYTRTNIDHFLATLSEQIINNEAALFLGTGLSINSGLPSWKSMLYDCANELGLSLDNEADLYAIAQFYANKYSDAELRRKISGQINKVWKTNELLENLLDVGFTNIWTTNYDKIIEQGLERRFIQYNSIHSDINLASINRHDKVTVYKMNGDISDPVNMVLTKNDYERYHSLHLYTFLFILHKNVFILGISSNWFKSFFTSTQQFYERKTHLSCYKVSVFLDVGYTK